MKFCDTVPMTKDDRRQTTDQPLPVSTILSRTIGVLVIFGFGFVIGSSGETSAAGMLQAVEARFGNIEDTPAEQLELDALWQAWSLLETKFVATENVPTDADKIEGLIRGLADSYGDPYTQFFNQEELEIFNNSVDGETFTGVGMEVGVREGLLRVVAPLKGSPAELAGLKPDDIIFNIDGEPSAELSIDQAISKIRGPEGTIVTLTILRQGVREPLVIDIARDVIDVPTIRWQELKDDKVFLISIYSFSANLNQDFRDALVAYEKSNAQGLVIDLRNNPGGYLNSAVEIGSWFTDPGQILVKEQSEANSKTPLANNEGKVYRSKGYLSQKTRNQPLVILVNGGSASASEILAGIIKDYNLGEVVGQQTFGKGSVQELIPLEGGNAIKITTARWLTPAGVSISEGGLSPDIEIVDDPDTVEIDEQLQRAIQEVLNRR